MSIVLDGTSGVVTPNINTANTFGFKNLLIDAGFTINQRAYVSGATLSSGSYGHDRWKAGASGGDYTFTQLASSTTITIASGKSLIQVVEDKNVNGTSFVLSWTGTAQARYAVNGATPSGSYAASPILITGQTVGTTMSVEFNTGTLTNPQLELGSTATSFDVRDYGRELIMCQRYYQAYGYGLNGSSNDAYLAIGSFWSTSEFTAAGQLPVVMRASPTYLSPTVTNGYRIGVAGTNRLINSLSYGSSSNTSNFIFGYLSVSPTGTAGTAGLITALAAGAKIELSAEL